MKEVKYLDEQVLQLSFLLFVGMSLLSFGVLELSTAQGGPLNSFSEAEYDDSLVRHSVGNLFKLLEGAFGALIMVVAGLLAIVAASMGAYRAAVGMLVVAVGSFILRALVSLFFGADYPDYDATGSGFAGGGVNQRTIQSSGGSFGRNTLRASGGSSGFAQGGGSSGGGSLNSPSSFGGSLGGSSSSSVSGTTRRTSSSQGGFGGSLARSGVSISASNGGNGSVGSGVLSGALASGTPTRVRISSRAANLKREPGRSAPLVLRYPRGTTLFVKAVKGEWVEVHIPEGTTATKGQTAYIHHTHVQAYHEEVG